VLHTLTMGASSHLALARFRQGSSTCFVHCDDPTLVHDVVRPFIREILDIPIELIGC
jgi:hypothetical protein